MECEDVVEEVLGVDDVQVGELHDGNHDLEAIEWHVYAEEHRQHNHLQRVNDAPDKLQYAK